ncbi:hypothetical protein GOV05_01080 [Candidatus Woesearchaeota archaeon]|nr:hypothetical protein [Candidatus Woesearchaeota archaeon]
MLKKVFGKTTILGIDELNDFLDANSTKTLSKINDKVFLINQENTRVIEHIYHLLDTISPYNLRRDKHTDIELKAIESKISFLNQEMRLVINILSEEDHHVLLREQATGFVEKLKEFKEQNLGVISSVTKYFSDQVNVLLTKIDVLEKNMIEVNELLSQEIINDYYKLHSNIQLLSENKKKEKENSKETESRKADIIKIKNKLNEYKNKQNTLMMTESFKLSEKTYQDAKNISDEISKEKEDLETIFKDVLSLFKVYNSKYDDKYVKAYIDDPSAALISDYGLNITKKAEKMLSMIQKEKIKITKNKEEITQALKKISKKTLKDIKKRLDELTKQRQQKEMLLSKNKVMLDIIELDYQIDHLLKKIGDIEIQVASLIDDSGIDYDKLLDESLKQIYGFTHKKVKIKQ